MVVNGYFDDNDIRLRVPVIDAELSCCEKFHSSTQNFTIKFENEQANDQFVIKLGRNSLKGKYRLQLKNGAGRSQVVQYKIYRIDSGGHVSSFI